MEGDLIFLENKTSDAKAIKLITGSRFNHLGIIMKYRGKFIVLETNNIVRRTELPQFLKKGVKNEYLVKRFKDYKNILVEDNLRKLREVANIYIGKPYDLYYGWGDEKIYPSELIWKVIKDALNIEIAKLKKMKDYDLSNPYVKLIISQKFGKEIPLDEDTIFPRDILDSDLLTTVFPKNPEDLEGPPNLQEMNIEEDIKKE